MGELTSSFSQDDIATLIDAMSDWESVGNEEYHIMQVVKAHPLPDNEHESYEFIRQMKEHFKQREKDLKRERNIRQEKAILVKAKLVLLRQEGGISKLFEVAAEEAEDKKEEPTLTKAQQNRLELAEFFINDLGVWKMYQKFLEDRGVKPTVENTTSEDDGEWFHSE
jgi:hypothetical protein